MVDNFPTSDSGVATMSSMGTCGTDTTPTSPNIFDIAFIQYGFDYPVIDDDNGDGVDVDVSEKDDDANIENNDEENAEKLPPVAQTLNRDGENHPHRFRLRRSEGVPFQGLENRKVFPILLINTFVLFSFSGSS